MRRAVLLGPALLLLAACGGEAASEVSSTASTTEASVTLSAPAATSAPSPASSTPAADAEVDVTAEMQAASGDVVTAAVRTGDQIVVDTTIVDPRGGSGSPAGQQAVAVCQDAVDLLVTSGAVAPTVRVQESDGTTFAAYLQVALGDIVPAQQCTEY